MKYRCLGYLSEPRLNELPAQNGLDDDQEPRSRGHCIAPEALESVPTATTVRVRSGKVAVTDDPFPAGACRMPRRGRAVLGRPDGFVAWRSREGVAAPRQRLGKVPCQLGLR